ncbi:MAG TPA: hypothetical protein VJR25_15230 [Microbacterium sp.]|uniref:hypothetical protein n=1 Tax=Microbacterium sp. TaxID=51671 RepID=UPI002B47A7A5|nr:hypothetical protein [Microbacterium sp.]HKT58112.1 hypothetical protein [Microbacterium sp.]
MFIVCLVLFVAGILCFGFAFSVVPGLQAVIFILGLLLIALAMGIPIHTTRRNSASR